MHYQKFSRKNPPGHLNDMDAQQKSTFINKFTIVHPYYIRRYLVYLAVNLTRPREIHKMVYLQNAIHYNCAHDKFVLNWSNIKLTLKFIQISRIIWTWPNNLHSNTSISIELNLVSWRHGSHYDECFMLGLSTRERPDITSYAVSNAT